MAFAHLRCVINGAIISKPQHRAAATFGDIFIHTLLCCEHGHLSSANWRDRSIPYPKDVSRYGVLADNRENGITIGGMADRLRIDG